MKRARIAVWIFVSGWASAAPPSALEIIRRADEVRSPNKPFRYTVTIEEYKSTASQPTSKQILDISMRFIKPEKDKQADARSLVRVVWPARDRGKRMLSNWYQLWFYTPELRRPIPISPQQRLLGQIANSDVIVTNFEYAYHAERLNDAPCGETFCYRLALTRKLPAATWPRIVYWVEKGGDYRPWKAAYYSLDDKLIKQVLYQNYQPVLGRARPTKIVVQDLRHGQAYSVMEYSDIRFESLPESYFTKAWLQRGGQ